MNGAAVGKLGGLAGGPALGNGGLELRIVAVLIGEQHADLAAVVTYQRNGLGNSTGDLVQPADVKALRK